MQTITLNQFLQQWTNFDPASKSGAKKSVSPKAILLDHNVFDFTTLAGKCAKAGFKRAFSTGGFYGGDRWKARDSKWGRKFTHATLLDSGSLRDGIGDTNKDIASKSSTTHKYSYTIETTEASKAERGKRGKNNGGRDGGSYAAVHNSDPSVTGYTVNQWSSRAPERRQFIGHSMPILNEIQWLYVPLIFKGFP